MLRPAVTSNRLVVATVYRHQGFRALISVGSWLTQTWRGKLHLNWTRLGLAPSEVVITELDTWGKPQRYLKMVEFQEELALKVTARDGVLLRIERLSGPRYMPRHDKIERGRAHSTSSASGQASPVLV